jgi:competence protein ComEC
MRRLCLGWRVLFSACLSGGWQPTCRCWLVGGNMAPLPMGVILAALLAGNAVVIAAQPAFTEIDAAWYNERGEVRLIGVVNRPPVRVDNSALRTASGTSHAVIQSGRSERSYPVEGLVLIRMPSDQKLSYGDRVRISGKLETPPDDDDFSYRAYLARKGIHSLMRVYTPSIKVMAKDAGSPLLGSIYALRERAYIALNRSIPQPEASLLAGILLGIESDMAEDLKDAFQTRVPATSLRLVDSISRY